MFLLNSRLGHFTAAGVVRRRPFSRSYGAILPSSLTRFLSRALVFSHLPTCVGLWYGRRFDNTRFFLAVDGRGLAIGVSPDTLAVATFGWLRRSISGGSPRAAPCGPHASTLDGGTGMLTRCPSATPFGLALGPD